MENMIDASIHFPLAREDSGGRIRCVYCILLQSTSLLRGKTIIPIDFLTVKGASIHFPLAREDELSAVNSSLENASIHFPLAREDVYEPSRSVKG